MCLLVNMFKELLKSLFGFHSAKVILYLILTYQTCFLISFITFTLFGMVYICGIVGIYLSKNHLFPLL